MQGSPQTGRDGRSVLCATGRRTAQASSAEGQVLATMLVLRRRVAMSISPIG